ncbi:unnamed protein product [Adineta ricciae]|uniref:Secreted protein n=1 Tax=Adineta ricciae TaxID=249248 RepID=A0A814HXD4_ADIRI|nr:unnamed protein product [Adineta ricciae]
MLLTIELSLILLDFLSFQTHTCKFQPDIHLKAHCKQKNHYTYLFGCNYCYSWFDGRRMARYQKIAFENILS